MSKLTDQDPETPQESQDGMPEEEVQEELREEETELETALRERGEYLASWQRSQADYQNMRRRMQQELDAHARRAKQPLLSDMLLIIDQLELALAIPKGDDEADGFRAGIELTRDQFMRTLENEGVSSVPAKGAFDPAVHQAMATVETTDVGPGEIVETMRRGYTWGDTVLRYAQVCVAAAPENKQGDAASEADGD
jgi:molecular chaperone GrpE